MNQPRDERNMFSGLQAAIVLEHREWMESNRDRTLAQLQDRLKTSLRQCHELVLRGDAVVRDVGPLPRPLADEVALWPQSGSDRAIERLSDVGALLAGYVWRVSVLETVLGGETPIERLLTAADCDG